MSSKLSFPGGISASAYFRISTVVLVCFGGLALGTAGLVNFSGAAASHAEPSQILSGQTVSVIFDPLVAAGAAQSQNKAVPSAQDGHEWDGIASVPDPLE